ncbi:MAG: hypothetical protein V2I37_08595 [Marinilabiliaceae bacterium]|jgi:photosystem II stability/assembly factor-like uncharacterized protein|nr:hypothetical protein [Marinilabiliaceae bacterium]
MRTISIFLLLSFSLLVKGQQISSFTESDDFKYRNVGPSRGGRVTAVAGVESDASTYYMGATGGGVWKTTDYGKSWRNISDAYFKTASIGSIAVFQENPDIIYVGTGSDGLRSNVIIGKGAYKSEDAGKTWSCLGLENVGQIGAVIIDPENPDRVFMAAIGNPFGPNDERGVYRTLDGGDTWEKVLFISENTGVCDLEFHPGNTDIIYASAWTARRKPWTIISGSEEGGIFRTVDGGSVWTKLSADLPAGIVGKSDLAVCRAEPDMLYALIEAENDQGGLYISKNMGDSFTLAGKQSFLLDRPFYYTNIDVDPTNPDIIYSNSTGFYRSSDRGKSWQRRSTPHGDNHDMWINPSNPEIYIQSNDGGANITLNGGVTWSEQNNQPTAELYQVNVDDQVPYWLYAGQQDNSTVAIPSTSSVSYSGMGRGGSSFISVGGCETGPAVPKPGNPDIVYSNCKGRFGRFNKVTGVEKQYYVGAWNMYGHNPKDLKYRFQRVSPILVSPHDPNTVYHASQYLHRTRDEGVTWETISPDLTAFEPDKQVISGSPITRDITGEEFYSTIYAVAESPRQKGVIWTGANDGPVYVTKDSGENWKNVTPPVLLPGGRVQTIEASPHKPAKAFFAVYRYLLDDWAPYIFKTNDYGENWTLIVNGIPADEPVRVIREDPVVEGLLYAGTESGIYISFDDGESWSDFRLNLPVVPVTDIKIFRNDMVISTMGRSFWILDDISPLRHIEAIAQGDVNYLFKPADTYRSPSVSSVPISYFLAEADTGLELIIEDPQGREIMKYAGDSNRKPSNNKGFNRIYWDMSSYGAQSSGGRQSRGPRVPPQRYTLRLKINGVELKSAIEVLPDPLMVADGLTFASYNKQFNLSLDIISLIDEASSLTDNVRSDLDGLNSIKESGKKLSRKQTKTFEQLTEIYDKMVTARITYPRPMLNDQIRYLYSMVSGADQEPGKDAFIRLEELRNELALLLEAYNQLID